MGLFYDRQLNAPAVEQAVRSALATNPNQFSGLQELNDEADRRAAIAAQTATQSAVGSIKAGPLVTALAIIAVLIVVALWADNRGLQTSTNALWGLVGSVFGVVVGFLGGEH